MKAKEEAPARASAAEDRSGLARVWLPIVVVILLAGAAADLAVDGLDWGGWLLAGIAASALIGYAVLAAEYVHVAYGLFAVYVVTTIRAMHLVGWWVALPVLALGFGVAFLVGRMRRAEDPADVFD